MDFSYIKFVKAKNNSQEKKYEDNKHTFNNTSTKNETLSREYLNIVVESSQRPRASRKSPTSRKRTKSKISTRMHYKLNSIFTFCQQNLKQQTYDWIKQFGGEQLNNVFDNNNRTPLMVAIAEGNADIVEILLNAGALYDHALCFPNEQSIWEVKKEHENYKVIEVIRLFLRFRSISDVKELKSPQEENQADTKAFKCDVCQRMIIDCKTPIEHEASIAHQLAGQRFSQITPALTNFASIDQDNPGFKLMMKVGWNGTSGLGRTEQGRKFPVTGQFKANRQGLGFEIDDQDEYKGNNQKSKTIISQCPRLSSKKQFKKAWIKKQKREQAIEANFRRQFYENW